MKNRLMTVAAFLFMQMSVGMVCLPIVAQTAFSKAILRETNDAFFQSSEARRIGDQVLLYQRCTGGWPKNIDMARRMTDKEIARVIRDKSRRDDSTIDNDATSMQMIYLARLFRQTSDVRYRDAFRNAVQYLLDGQYENGGWPQFWPNMHGYQFHITYNDDAIVNIMEMFLAMIDQRPPYDHGLTDQAMRDRLRISFNKGIDCILSTQILVKGKPTVWCQQHDSKTLKPAPARAFELPSFCSAESAALVRLLMEVPNPDKRIKEAVHGAMKWFDTYKLTGLKVVRSGRKGAYRDARLVCDSMATPIWARFYSLEHCEPFVCDRDGIPRRRLEDIGMERRTGYAWYNDRASNLYPLYNLWANRYDPKHKIKIRLDSKGANENGLIDLYRKPLVNRKNFNVVVNPGESIQKAIEKAPEHSTSPFKILLLKGTYKQKVIIDRPHIVLVGENRDETKIEWAETTDKRIIKEYKGKPVNCGVIVLQEGADDCVISGLTVYNNYGTTVEKTTRHQMAIFGRATRTIIVNCNVWADGNDALALWAPDGNGMYYHADLDLRCPGVDFLCPRGWCYATRCHFYGDGRAMIWHDGRGERNKKLVITNSLFDAKSPTLLGRYHHDSQFFILHSLFSKNVLNQNICYAYSDKVLDNCPWGQRTYYYDCHREGGQNFWLTNNLDKSDDNPAFYAVTASWTFAGRWNPEQQIRDLWKVLAY